MVLAAILLLMYSLTSSSGYSIMDGDADIAEALSLPTEYYFRVEVIDLLNDIHEPLELWYSASHNRSRIDVRGGVLRRFYYWGGVNPILGTVYTIHAKTTETKENKLACLKQIISDESRDHEAFPTNIYTYAGTKHHEGRQVDVWEYIEGSRATRWEEYLYTYKVGDVDVPVQCIKKYFNVLKGIIQIHKLYNYFEYDPVVQSGDLDVKKYSICKVKSNDAGKYLGSVHPDFIGDLDIAFNRFKIHHNKNYRNIDEHEMRKELFEKNWKLVVEHNSRGLSYKMAVNQLSDRTPAELRQLSGARRSPHPAGSIPYPHSDEQVAAKAADLPAEYDMRLEGYISPIKNQQSCGSCWAFAVTATVEGALARADGRILDLSEQTLIDCDWTASHGNAGCEGGFSSNALRYVSKHGLPLDEAYGGYLSLNGFCHLKNVSEVFKIRGYTLVTPQSVNAMKIALVEHGPVVVYIQATDDLFSYSSGIFYDTKCTGPINHAVTIVGFGVRDGVDYWIIKNSWGRQWGEAGYFLLSTADDNCFVLDESYYAVV